MRFQKWFLAGVLVVTVLASTTSPAAASTVSTIDVPGANLTQAFGINNLGQIVGFYRPSMPAPQVTHGFLLDGGFFITIDFPGASFTEAYGINDSGQIVGIYGIGVPMRLHGFLRNPNGSFVSIDAPGAFTTQAFGINNSGEIVGFYRPPGGPPQPPAHGFVLAGGIFTTIDVLGANETQATGINSSGQVAGFYVTGAAPPLTNHGFIEDNGMFNEVVVPGAAQAQARAINDSGQIVGRHMVAGIQHSFLLDHGVFTTIDVPGATGTNAFGMNDRGQIVGNYVVGVGPTATFHGFLLSGNTLASVGPASVWVGLKNSDDQGTQFDIGVDVYDGGTLVSSGTTLCVTGITRNPASARLVTVALASPGNAILLSGDTLTFKVKTRIGTNPDGSKCSGPGGSHSNAVGLRLYYDASHVPSGFAAEVSPDPAGNFYLHSGGGVLFFDSNVPPAGTAKTKDSAAVNFASGNPWKDIGAWTRVQP